MLLRCPSFADATYGCPGDPLDKFVHIINSGFAEMVLYIEACESGSLFEGTLDDSLKIYAVVCSSYLHRQLLRPCKNPPQTMPCCLLDCTALTQHLLPAVMPHSVADCRECRGVVLGCILPGPVARPAARVWHLPGRPVQHLLPGERVRMHTHSVCTPPA